MGTNLWVKLTPGEDGYVLAEAPSLPGCRSQGKTREEALRNVAEAASLCIEELLEEGREIPNDSPQSDFTLEQIAV